VGYNKELKKVKQTAKFGKMEFCQSERENEEEAVEVRWENGLRGKEVLWLLMG
jgi:hypothetical protein